MKNQMMNRLSFPLILSESKGTHAITPDQKGNPIDVLAGDIFLTYVAHD